MTVHLVHDRLSKEATIQALDPLVRELEAIERKLLNVAVFNPREYARLRARIAECETDGPMDMLWAIKSSAVSLSNALRDETDELARELDAGLSERILADMPDRRAS